MKINKYLLNLSSKLIQFLLLTTYIINNDNIVDAKSASYRDVRTMRKCWDRSSKYCMPGHIAYFWNMSLSNILISIIAICIFSFFAFFAFSRYSANNEQIFGFYNPLYQRVENPNQEENNQSTAIEMNNLLNTSQNPDQGK